jgi:hypothetical protein
VMTSGSRRTSEAGRSAVRCWADATTLKGLSL